MATVNPQNGVLWPQPGDAPPPRFQNMVGGHMPNYQGMTHRQLNVKMMARTTRRKPCYKDPGRGWAVLGYCGAAKPTWPVFRRHVNNLWAFCNHRYSKHREMRVAILDALRALGVRNPRWKVTFQARDPRGNLTPWLFAGYPDSKGEVGYANGEGKNGGWEAVPAPPARVPKGKSQPTDIDVFADYAIEPGNPRSNFEIRENMMRQIEIWQKLHRYHGFQSIDTKLNSIFFKAFPVPEGPDSLWHAISYFRGAPKYPEQEVPAGHPPKNIFDHADVKARLFSYFLSTLLDSTHPRYRDYHALQASSEQVNVPGYGQGDILRTLTSSREQGRAAYLHAKNFLHVVADFFATQVVVFYYDPNDNTWHGKHVPEWVQRHPAWLRDPPGNPGLDPMNIRGPIWHKEDQDQHDYSACVFGFYNENEPQIFLVTADWMHFDPADFAAPDFDDKLEFNVALEYAAAAKNRRMPPRPTRYLADDRGNSGAGRLWWNRHEAGKPLPPGCPPLVFHLDPPPYTLPHHKPGPEWKLKKLGLDRRAWLHLQYDSPLLRFRAGLDIDLNMFETPTLEEIMSWTSWKQSLPRATHPQMPVGPGNQGFQCKAGPYPTTGAVVMDNPEYLYDSGEVDKRY